MHWYQFVSTDHGITVSVAWWAPVVSIAALIFGIVLFRAMAVGGLPWIFSNFGVGRFGRYTMLFAMLPAGAFMVLGVLGLFKSLKYKIQVDEQGIYWDQGSHSVQRDSWDRLWDCKVYNTKSVGQRMITLEFFQGDNISFSENDAQWGGNFSILMDFIARQVREVDLDDQRSRLLRGHY